MTQGFTLWFTGLSGAGKTTLTNALIPQLRARGVRVEVLDEGVHLIVKPFTIEALAAKLGEILVD